MKSPRSPEEFESESKRIARVFGVECFQLKTAWFTYQYAGYSQGTLVVWELDWFTGQMISLTLATGKYHCSVIKNAEGWMCYSDKHLNECMALGLYHLGFEDMSLLEELHPSQAGSLSLKKHEVTSPVCAN